MKIVVRTNHPIVLLGLSEGAPLGVHVEVPPVIERRDINVPAILEAIVHVSRDVEIALLSTWLFEKVKPAKNSAKLHINTVQVEIEHGEITRVISTQITNEKQN